MSATIDLQALAQNLHVDAGALEEEVKRLMPDGTISAFDYADLAARTAASHNLTHYDYGLLGGKILATFIQSDTSPTFGEAVERLYHHEDSHGHCPLVSKETYDFVMEHRAELDSTVRPERDLDLSFFSIRTLTRAYLLKDAASGRFIETPQYLFLRVAVGICKGSLEQAVRVYHDMSQRYYVHATPTLFNSGTPRPQLSSCYLLTMKEDSLDGIFDTFKSISRISRYAGGIGISISNVRACGSRIRGSNGTSNGLVPLLRVLNNISVYVDQSGKRKGSIATYLEPWHADILEFLELRLPVGSEELRCRDLFTALWVPSLFMERVQSGGMWSLMCPNECPGLQDSYGEAFNELYTKYEREGRFKRQVKAQDVWMKILTSQVESGMPYLLYKDHVNEKNAQKNLGTIRSSNLCTEVVLFTSKDETAVCNLASICLPQYIRRGGDGPPTFDFDLLEEKTRQVVRNLNRVIDINFYPTEEAKRSNMRHRPTGIGVQGLSDCFQILDLDSYECDDAMMLDMHIFETIYFAALTESCNLAQEQGPYSSFEGSPASKGLLQFDLWDKTEHTYSNGRIGSLRWEELKDRIRRFGLANSCLISPMPTASTSQIMNSFVQAFHPIPSVLYQRRTQAGDYLLICPNFVDDMIREGAWTPEVQERLQICDGRLDDPRIGDLVPERLKTKYRSVWAMRQKAVVDHSVIRAPFIDQTQSLELWMEKPDTKTLTNMHFYSHKKGLKTSIYYLRTQSKIKSLKFNIGEQQQQQQAVEEEEECLNCGS